MKGKSPLPAILALIALWILLGGKLPWNPLVPPAPEVGPRTVLVIHESADSTPAFAMLVTALRQPPHSVYLKDKGHSLSVLDDESVNEDGQPSPVVEAWRSQFAGMTLPVVLVVDPATKSLVHKQSLPATAKADDVIGILKSHGG